MTMVPQQQTSLATLPDYAKALAKPSGDYSNDWGELDSSDFSINMLKLSQSTSKQRIPGWNGPGSASLPEGTMFLSKTALVVPPGTSFVPLIRRVSYILFEGVGDDGKVMWRTENREDPRIVAINGLAFRKDAKGKALPPLVTKCLNFYIFLSMPGQTEPVLLPFKSTSTDVGKLFAQGLHRQTHPEGQELPMWLFRYTLGTPNDNHNEKGYWKTLNIQPAGMLPQAAVELCKNMKDLAEAIATAASDAEAYEEDGAHASTPSTPIKTVTGAVLPSTQSAQLPEKVAALPEPPPLVLPSQQAPGQPQTAQTLQTPPPTQQTAPQAPQTAAPVQLF